MNRMFRNSVILFFFLLLTKFAFADGDNKFKQNSFKNKGNKNLPPMETTGKGGSPIPAGIAILLVGSLVFWGQKVRKKIKE